MPKAVRYSSARSRWAERCSASTVGQWLRAGAPSCRPWVRPTSAFGGTAISRVPWPCCGDTTSRSSRGRRHVARLTACRAARCTSAIPMVTCSSSWQPIQTEAPTGLIRHQAAPRFLPMSAARSPSDGRPTPFATCRRPKRSVRSEILQSRLSKACCQSSRPTRRGRAGCSSWPAAECSNGIRPDEGQWEGRSVDDVSSARDVARSSLISLVILADHALCSPPQVDERVLAGVAHLRHLRLIVLLLLP